LVLFLLF
jgi:hypothetical protein